MTELIQLHRSIFPHAPHHQWLGYPDDLRDGLLSYAIMAGIEVCQLLNLTRSLALAENATEDDPVRPGLWSLDGVALDNTIDWDRAVAEFKRDMHLIRYEIDHGTYGLQDLDIVLQVQLHWYLFLSARCPILSDRAGFAKAACDLEARMLGYRARWDASVARQQSQPIRGVVIGGEERI